MDDLIQKYLDGDLSEGEAAEFSRELAENPALDAELAAFENILALAARSATRETSPAFTDDVMDRINASVMLANEYAVKERTHSRRGWMPRLAWAAGFAAVFAIGFVTARQVGPDPVPGSVNEERQPVAAVAAQSNAPAPLRLVRLVYVAPDREVNQVAVAGSFNGWNPEETFMRKEGGAWVVQLVLPPQTYEYMFIEDGKQWVTDPLASQTRDDGFGRKNAVLDLTI